MPKLYIMVHEKIRRNKKFALFDEIGMENNLE